MSSEFLAPWCRIREWQKEETQYDNRLQPHEGKQFYKSAAIFSYMYLWSILGRKNHILVFLSSTLTVWFRCVGPNSIHVFGMSTNMQVARGHLLQHAGLGGGEWLRAASGIHRVEGHIKIAYESFSQVNLLSIHAAKGNGD